MLVTIAPVGFYATRNAWDFAPGYEHDVAPDFTRPITSECLFCHTTSATLAPASVNRYTKITHGIQCERCHGDVTSHDKLLNPAKLAPRLRDSVCEQCHLAGQVRLPQPDRALREFRPGQNLAEYVEVWIGAPPGLRVNGHAEALAMSKCKLAAGDTLWCGSCHNPHRPATYNATCQTCHAQPHTKGDCISCHMKKGRPEDGGHTVFTDHTISAAIPAGTELTSYFERESTPRNHGLALAELATRDRNPALLEKAWPLLRTASASRPRDPQLYSTIAALLIADGRREQAIAYYRLSLQQDPLQTDVLKKLAAIVGNDEAVQLGKRADALLPVPKI